MSKPRKKTASTPRRRKARTTSHKPIVPLGVGAGDPLQPAGLIEYLAAPHERVGKPGAEAVPVPNPQAHERSAALRAAKARWSDRQKKTKTTTKTK